MYINFFSFLKYKCFMNVYIILTMRPCLSSLCHSNFSMSCWNEHHFFFNDDDKYTALSKENFLLKVNVGNLVNRWKDRVKGPTFWFLSQITHWFIFISYNSFIYFFSWIFRQLCRYLGMITQQKRHKLLPLQRIQSRKEGR